MKKCDEITFQIKIIIIVIFFNVAVFLFRLQRQYEKSRKTNFKCPFLGLGKLAFIPKEKVSVRYLLRHLFVLDLEINLASEHL